jgi:predicted PurR-regulated permease PerM
MAKEPEENAPTHVEVPRSIRVAADWAWRFLVIAAAVVALLLLVNRLKLVFLSVFVGLLVTALLAPVVRALQRHLQGRFWGRLRGSRGLATSIVLVISVAGLVAVIALLTIEISGSFKDLGSTFSDGLRQIRVFVRDNFNIDDFKLQDYLQRAWQALQDNRNGLLSGALSGATIALEVLSGAAIAFFTTVFFLLDGERIWTWCVSLFPRRSQLGVREAGLRSWVVLTAYVRGTIFIALTDAVFVGLSVAVIGVPLAVPLGVLVFFGAFVPIVGALVSGFVAVVVALAAKGVVAALAVLIAIIVVQQIEGHLLQPLVMGRLVSLHPLAVVLAVTAGSVLAGLVGAVVAVPVAAVVSSVLGYYGRRARAAEEVAGSTEVGGAEVGGAEVGGADVDGAEVEPA